MIEATPIFTFRFFIGGNNVGGLLVLLVEKFIVMGH